MSYKVHLFDDLISCLSNMDIKYYVFKFESQVKSGSKVVANLGLGSTLLLNIANILVVKTSKV